MELSASLEGLFLFNNTDFRNNLTAEEEKELTSLAEKFFS